MLLKLYPGVGRRWVKVVCTCAVDWLGSRQEEAEQVPECLSDQSCIMLLPWRVSVIKR